MKHFTRRQAFFVASRGPAIAARIGADKNASVSGVLGEDAARALDRFRNKKATEHDIAAICAAFFAKTYPVNTFKERHIPVMGWIVDRFLNDTHNGKPTLLEDIYKIGERVQYFTGLKATGVLPPDDNLLNYDSLQALDERLAPFYERRIRKERESLERHMPPETRAAIMAETTVLYQGKGGVIVIPHTLLSSQYWGNATKWCLSANKDGQVNFSDFNAEGPIVMFLPHAGEKMALVEGKYWDPADHNHAVPNETTGQLLDEVLAQIDNPRIRQFLLKIQPVVAAAPPAPKPVHDDGDLTAEEQGWLKRITASSWEWRSRLLPEELLGRKNFFMAAVRLSGSFLAYATSALQADREVVLAAVRQNGNAIQYAHPSLLSDREIVLEAARQNGDVLKYAHKSLLFDREIVLEAVRSFGAALQYADPLLRRDRDVVLEAVRDNGYALRYADRSLELDREIVLAAVKQMGAALKWASPELQNDREIVLAAVRQSGYVLEYASPALKKDREIVLEAVLEDLDAAKEAPAHWRRDSVMARMVLNSGKKPEQALKLRDTGLKIKKLSDDEILSGQIRALETLLAEGKDDIAADHLRFIKPLWGVPERIVGDPREQLEYLRALLPAPVVKRGGGAPSLQPR